METTEIQKIIQSANEHKNLLIVDSFVLKLEGGLKNNAITNQIVYGEVVEIVIEEGSPEHSQESGYIPLSTPSIIVQSGNNNGVHWEEIYIFNKSGWQHHLSY